MNFIRELLVLPVSCLIFLNRYLKIFKNLELYRWKWNIGGNIDDACRYLQMYALEKGIEEASSMAEALLERQKDSAIASCMGFLNIRIKRSLDGAEAWIKKAENTETVNPQMLLLLKLVIASLEERPERGAIIEEMLSRNDLPTSYTLTALCEKAEYAIHQNDWKTPEEIASYILDIMDYPLAHWLHWMCHMKNEKTEDAEKEFNLLKKQVNEPRLSYYLGLGYFYCGREEQSRSALKHALQAGFDYTLVPPSVRRFIAAGNGFTVSLP
ncbi:MAG: hypothetical protein JW881_09265 [Spirochaetales bacterium]|nr:hypothetical protein [Spirochaetales bacterium]